MNDIQIVEEFKRLVQEAYPDVGVYFYGSRVTRTHQEESDYDVLVVLGKIDPGIREVVYDIAWEIGFKYDVFISPVLAEREEFTRLSGSPFFNNIKQNGLAL